MIVPVNMKPLIIKAEFNLTKDEYQGLMNRLVDSKDERLDNVMRLYFGMKFSMKQVAKQLDVSTATIGFDVQKLRHKALRTYKKDLRQNKKIFNHMIDLVIQTEQRTKELWYQYRILQKRSVLIHQFIDLMHDEKNNDPEQFKKRSMKSLATNTHTAISLTNAQTSILSEIRQENLAVLKIWDTFGLTGKEAAEVMVTAGIDITLKVKELRETVFHLVKIVNEEVDDTKKQKTIFTRMTRLMKAGGYENGEQEEEVVDVIPE